MKLFLQFQDLSVSTNSNDIILTSDKNKLKLNCKIESVNTLVDYSYMNCLESYRNNILQSSHNKFVKSVFDSSINNYNRNIIIPVLSWVQKVEEIISTNQIEEIVIIGYVLHPSYVPYYEAEGEIGKKLFYKKYDFIPRILKEYLVNKGFKVKTIGSKNPLNLRFRIFVRRYILFFYKLNLFLFRKIQFKTRKINAELTFDSKKNNLLFLTRGIAQSEAIISFLNQFNSKCSILFSDGIVSRNTNENFLNKNSSLKNKTNYLEYIKFSDLIISFFICFRYLIFSHKINKLNLNGVSFDISNSLNEMIISYFDALVYQKSIDNYLKKHLSHYQKNGALVTCEMYTPFAYVTDIVSKKYNLKSYQLQTTTMIERLEPIFFYCDKFLFSTKRIAESFKKIYPQEQRRIDYYGNLNIVDDNIDNPQVTNPAIKNVIYFSQPKFEEDVEQDILNELVKLKDQFNFTLYIKPHPRDTLSKFDAFKEKIVLLDKNLTFDDYKETCDLAVMKSSSLGHQFLHTGIPVIFCLLTNYSQNIKIDFISKNYQGTILDISELENIFIHRNQFYNHFLQYRKNYINENELYKSASHFYNKIISDNFL